MVVLNKGKERKEKGEVIVSEAVAYLSVHVGVIRFVIAVRASCGRRLGVRVTTVGRH